MSDTQDPNKQPEVEVSEQSEVTQSEAQQPQVKAEVTQENNDLIIDDAETVEVEQSTVNTEADDDKDNVRISNRKPQKVIDSFGINSKHTVTTGEKIILPSDYDLETRKSLEQLPNVNLLDDPDTRRWANIVSQGLSLNTHNEAFIPTLEDEEAEFNNKLEHNNIDLAGRAPKFKPAENQNLKGDRAVIRVVNHLGLGTLFQAPLWHSGIYVTFKPPTETEIVELNRALMNSKILFGRYTYGLAYSNITSYTVNTIVDFIVSHIYDLTAKSEDITIENIRQHISCQDLPSLIWGFICTMYPKGFRYERACTVNPLKCNHIVEETLNVTKLQYTNLRTLNDWQKTFMSSRQSKVKSLADISRYKEELNKVQKRKVTISKQDGSSIDITLKTPSLGEYIEAGHRWIGDIVNIVDQALAVDSSDQERNELIVQYGQATVMRQYSHWVDSIELDTNIIDDQETVESNLDILSADDEIRDQFIKAVVDFINTSTISVIGIPVYDCPACGSEQPTSMTIPQYKNIIPLDMIQLFFDLHTQRLARITQR